MSLNEIQLQKEEMQEIIRLKEIEIEIEEKQRADEIQMQLIKIEQDEFEDTKGEIRSHKSTVDKQHNGDLYINPVISHVGGTVEHIRGHL